VNIYLFLKIHARLLQEAIGLLEPLLADKETYVRQGVVIALSFIMVQQNDVLCPRMSGFRDKLTKIVAEKTEDSIVKFGAVLATGIIDAGMGSAGVCASVILSFQAAVTCRSHWYRRRRKMRTCVPLPACYSSNSTGTGMLCRTRWRSPSVQRR
jgi:hypothetical protein